MSGKKARGSGEEPAVEHVALRDLVNDYLRFRLLTRSTCMEQMVDYLDRHGYATVVKYRPKYHSKDLCILALSIIGATSFSFDQFQEHIAQFVALRKKLNIRLTYKVLEEILQNDSPMRQMTQHSISWESIAKLFEWVWRMALESLKAGVLNLAQLEDAFASTLMTTKLKGMGDVTINGWVNDNGGWGTLATHSIHRNSSMIEDFMETKIDNKYLITHHKSRSSTRKSKSRSKQGDDGDKKKSSRSASASISRSDTLSVKRTGKRQERPSNEESNTDAGPLQKKPHRQSLDAGADTGLLKQAPIKRASDISVSAGSLKRQRQNEPTSRSEEKDRSRERKSVSSSSLSLEHGKTSVKSRKKSDAERCPRCDKLVHRQKNTFTTCECVIYYCTYPACTQQFANHKAVGWSIRNHYRRAHKLLFNYM